MLVLLLRDNTTNWYTDGSKPSESISAGITGPRIKLSLPMGRTSSGGRIINGQPGTN